MPDLLSESERLKGEIKSRTELLDTINAEIRDKIRDAEYALVNGWNVSLREVSVKEHVVAARKYRRLSISRIAQ